MANLDRHLGLGVLMHKVGDATPSISVRVAPDAGASGRDPPLCAHIGHLGVDQCSAALGETAVVHQVPVVGHAICGAIHAHGRDANPILQ